MTVRRGAARIGLLLAVAFTVAACQFGREPTMAGVNRTEEDAVVRLVLVSGAFRDFALPRNSLVLLDRSLNVDRAVMVDQNCREIGTSVFGKGNNSFFEGGQMYLEPPDVSGMTTELSVLTGSIATSTDRCLDVPTPIDPRLRQPSDGGGSRP
ncbi:MAG TPA: hypothetical protein VFP56_09955 [Candidatus Limnocylindrales bacterium]|nr:hypothetical protein [Candidatus Limnocylindrales bacterium]